LAKKDLAKPEGVNLVYAKADLAKRVWQSWIWEPGLCKGEFGKQGFCEASFGTGILRKAGFHKPAFAKWDSVTRFAQRGIWQRRLYEVGVDKSGL
jgi:hypothetical protein